MKKKKKKKSYDSDSDSDDMEKKRGEAIKVFKKRKKKKMVKKKMKKKEKPDPEMKKIANEMMAIAGEKLEEVSEDSESASCDSSSSSSESDSDETLKDVDPSVLPSGRKGFGKFMFEKRKPVKIEEIGATVIFTSHSHKRTKRGGKSPLLMYFTIQLEGETPVQESFSIVNPTGKEFHSRDTSRKIYFKTVGYSYNKNMELFVSVKESYFDELQETRKKNEMFRKNVTNVPYHVILYIIEYHQLQFHEMYEEKDSTKLFFGYFSTDFTRKVFQIFTSIQYKRWMERKHMPLQGTKNLSFSSDCAHIWSKNESEFKEMKSLVSLDRFQFDTLEIFKTTLLEKKSLERLTNGYLQNIAVEKYIEVLNENQPESKQLIEIDFDTGMNSDDFERITKSSTEDQQLNLPQLRNLRLRKIPLENCFRNKVLTNLRSVHISYWTISKEQFDSILVNTQLRKLVFISCDCKDLETGNLEKMLNLRCLKELSFAWSKNLKKDTMVSINKSRLEVLNFESTGKIGVKFVESLCLGLSGCLKRINFVGNKLSKECTDLMVKEGEEVWGGKNTKLVLGYRSDHDEDFGLNELYQKFDVQCY